MSLSTSIAKSTPSPSTPGFALGALNGVVLERTRRCAVFPRELRAPPECDCVRGGGFKYVCWQRLSEFNGLRGFFYTFMHLFFATMGGGLWVRVSSFMMRFQYCCATKKKCIVTVPYVVARVDGWCGQRTHTFVPPQYQDSLKLRNDRIIKNQQHVRALSNIFTYSSNNQFFILWQLWWILTTL